MNTNIDYSGKIIMSYGNIGFVIEKVLDAQNAYRVLWQDNKVICMHSGYFIKENLITSYGSVYLGRILNYVFHDESQFGVIISVDSNNTGHFIYSVEWQSDKQISEHTQSFIEHFLVK